MTCPRCGWQQPDAPECGKCGVLVARYHARPRPEPAARPGPTQATEAVPSGRDATLGRDLILLAASAAIALIVYRWPDPTGLAPNAAPDRAGAAMVPRHARTRLSAATAALRGTRPAQSLGEPGGGAATPSLDEPIVAASCPLDERGFGAVPGRGPVPPNWYTTGADYERARQEQETAAAPLVVYVYTDWCGYCRAFERDLLSRVDVDGYLTDRAVKLRINPEKDGTSKALAQQLGGKGYPSFFVVTPGAEPKKLSIYAEKTQLKTSDEFIQDIEDRMERQARELRKRGVAAQQGHRLDESVDLLSLALRMKPDDPEAYLQRGRARLEAGAMDDAFDDLARAARLKPGDPASYEIADRFFMREKYWDETVACWTSFLDRNPSDAKAYLARARALRSKGAHAASRADVEQACELGDAAACGWADTGPKG